jgi:predicted amidohydrolase
MTSSKELVALQFPFFEDRYEENLEKLTTLIEQAPEDSVVVAPELCLTNFSFDKLDEAAAFGRASLPHLLALSEKKIIAFTMTEKIDGKFYNSAKILHRGRVIHSQPKVKLFTFGNEDKFFSPGSAEKIKIVEIDNIRYCILICFEIRFIKLWLQIQGADIILIPALWGKLRKEQLEAISQSMAILNEAFVVLANSANDDMAKSSGIVTPFGIEYRDDRSQYLSHTADLKEIQKMRRYMDIGIR